MTELNMECNNLYWAVRLGIVEPTDPQLREAMDKAEAQLCK